MHIDFRGEGRERMKERNVDVREKHGLVASCMCSNCEPDSQPRHVLTGNRTCILSVYRMMLQLTEPRQPGISYIDLLVINHIRSYSLFSCYFILKVTHGVHTMKYYIAIAKNEVALKYVL